MDRLQFIGSIDHGNFVSSEDAIIQFFDHTMAAYDLIGQYNDDIDVVKSSIESPLCMRFTISFLSPDQALCMIDKIINYFHNHIEIYGKTFHITPNVNGSTIGIQILQS